MFWLAPDTVPTLGDWFRAGGYRTFYKGKWHVSHPHLDDPDGEGYLLSIEDDGTPIPENIAAYLEADLLDEYGFSEWVGPDPHGLGKHNTGDGEGCLHGRRDGRVAEAARPGGERPALADRVLVPEPARHRPVRRHRAGAGAALRHRRHARGRRTRRPTTRICRPSRPASRATSMRGGRCSRRSRGSRRTGSSTTSSRARSTARSGEGARRAAGDRRRTRTRSWSSSPTTATCSAPTAACTRSGTTPTRRRRTCRSSSPAR